MRLALVPVAAGLALALAAQASAAPGEQLLASVWNSAACSFTDNAALTLSSAATVTRLDLWYGWRSGETSTPYAITQYGQTVSRGVLRRAECDSYQTSWCVARDTPGLRLGPGAYQVRVGRAAICQNGASRGQGFIRAYGRAVTTNYPPPPPPPPPNNGASSSTHQSPDCNCRPGDQMCLTLCHHDPGRPPGY